MMGQSPVSSSYNTDGIGLPFYQGNADFGEVSPVARVWCTDPKKVAQPGDIPISVRAPIGAINIAAEKCCIGRGLAAIRPIGSNLDVDYLVHLFRASRHRIESMGTGSTFKAVGKKVLSELLIPVYCQERQREIAFQLTRIIECIRASGELANKLDSVVKSRFAEMFGDAGWPVATVGSLAVDVRYGTSKKASDCGQYVYLRMNNITDDGRLNLDDVKHIDLNGPELEKCRVVDGDLLFNRTNSREKVGKTVVFHEREPMVIAGYIIRVRLGDRIRPDFLATYMNLPTTKAMLRSIAKGAVHQANINSRELSAIEVPVPPMELQDRFLSFAARVDKSRFIVQQQIEKLQMLYDSLAQEYFS